MLNMSQIDGIRNAHAAGMSVSQIARDLHFDRKTVRKYLECEDFSESLPRTLSTPSILDPYKDVIDGWLQDDRRRWHKQRHTAKRIYDRLCAEHAYIGSYPTVQRYVKQQRALHREVSSYLELVWHPGQAQCDFGEADFEVMGQLERLHFVVLSFPHSNHAYVQVFRGETSECLCQGLRDMFHYMGFVPTSIVFDNASGIGRLFEKQMHESDLFRRFRLHYRFKARYCNPSAGHEKGHVENKVGFMRRNLFVPLRQADDVNALNQGLLGECEAYRSSHHYKKSQLVDDLFRQDLASMYPLPSVRFDVVRYETRKADGYGKVCLDGKHYYSSRPELNRQELLVAIRAHTIQLYDTHHQLVVEHERAYGPKRTDTTDPYTTLLQLMRSPNAWHNSALREALPHPLKDKFDGMSKEQRTRSLRVLMTLNETYDKEISAQALLRSLERGVYRYADAALHAAQIQQSGLDGRDNTDMVNLNAYDALWQSQEGSA